VCPPTALQKRDAAGLPHGDTAIFPGGQFKVTVDGKGKELLNNIYIICILYY
jgi:hypothetical protein